MPNVNATPRVDDAGSRSGVIGAVSGMIAVLLRACMRAQWLVGGSCAIVALLYPQTEVYGFIFGAFINAFIGKLLKRILKHDRPLYVAAAGAAKEVVDGAASAAAEAGSEMVASAVDAAVLTASQFGVAKPNTRAILSSLPHPQRTDKELGHGMPSSHAMSLAFFASYLSLTAMQLVLTPPSSSTSHPMLDSLRSMLPSSFHREWDKDLSWRVSLVAVLYGLVLLECANRVRRRLHSSAQILVGLLLGSLNGFIHHRYGMAWIREQFKHTSTLAERSVQFKIALTIALTLVSALTLERHTQRFAKRLLKKLLNKVTGSITKPSMERNNMQNGADDDDGVQSTLRRRNVQAGGGHLANEAQMLQATHATFDAADVKQSTTDSASVTPIPPATSLPPDVEPYKRTATFTDTTVPKGLLREHTTKAGVWGLIHVEQGTLLYHVTDPRRIPKTTQLTPDVAPGIIEPQILHQVEPVGDVQFYVEFHSVPSSS